MASLNFNQITPKTAAILLRYWRRDIIQTRSTHRALLVLFNNGFRGRDLDLAFDVDGPVKAHLDA